MLPFSDSHCHLDYYRPQLLSQDPRAQLVSDDSPAACLARARRAGVGRIIALAIGAMNFAAVAELETLAGVFPAYGLHPLYQAAHRPEHLKLLAERLARPATVAVGECGLDGGAPAPAEQRRFFVEQIGLGRELALPLLIHSRGALEEVLQLLKRERAGAFVIHSFTGSDVQLAKVLALGGLIGVGGTCSYRRAQRLRRQLAQLPADRYLLETDGPDQPISGRQGAVNYPELIPLIAAELAQLRGESLAAVSAASEANFQGFFFPRGH